MRVLFVLFRIALISYLTISKQKLYLYLTELFEN